MEVAVGVDVSDSLEYVGSPFRPMLFDWLVSGINEKLGVNIQLTS